jgi:hypothetical protein
MNKKWIGLLFVIVFVSSSVYVVALTYPSESSATQDGSHGSGEVSTISTVENEVVNEDTSIPENVVPEILEWEGFYSDIGDMYTAITDDGLRIKVFRYHAPGLSFNYGTQPVLLFSGLCMNMNQYLTRSTPELLERYDVSLPDDLAEWAQGDENIERDPMLYYSMAYYLWAQGYDPWFANYRGTGYGEAKSDDGDKKTTLDEFALYDVRAAVRKVYSVTGLHPAIGGHSTGGLVGVMYLQGCQFRSDGHVRSYNELVNERNGVTDGPETIAGFIGLDPAWIPGMTKLLDNLLIWLLLDTDIIFDIRGLLETMIFDCEITSDIVGWLLELITGKFGELAGDILYEIVNLDVSNINDALMFSFVAYGADKLYFRSLAQYLSFIAHDTVREHFKNGGFWNELKVLPPSPRDGDGYYYYIDNCDKISVPTITFLAEMENEIMDLVDGDKVIRDIVNGKTYNENDECYIIEGAHIDMPIGLRAPQDLYPKLGAWLAEI